MPRYNGVAFPARIWSTPSHPGGIPKLAVSKTLASSRIHPKKAAARALLVLQNSKRAGLCMPTGNIPRFTHQAHTATKCLSRTPSPTACAWPRCSSCPSWVQHLTAADGGLTAVGGGKISQEEIFGKTNKKGVTVGGAERRDELISCLKMGTALAIVGNAAIWFSVLAIIVSYYGNMKQKQAVAGRRGRERRHLAWAVGVRWRHPVHATQWNDDPASPCSTPPMRLLLGEGSSP